MSTRRHTSIQVPVFHVRTERSPRRSKKGIVRYVAQRGAHGLVSHYAYDALLGRAYCFGEGKDGYFSFYESACTEDPITAERFNRLPDWLDSRLEGKKAREAWRLATTSVASTT
jgi:hypothetical protein